MAVTDISRAAYGKSQTSHQKPRLVSLRLGVDNILSTTTSGPSTVSRNALETPILAMDSCTTPVDEASSLIASMDSLFTIESARLCSVCRRMSHPLSQCPFVPDYQWKCFSKLWNSNFRAYLASKDNKDDRRDRKRRKFKKKTHFGKSSQVT